MAFCGIFFVHILRLAYAFLHGQGIVDTHGTFSETLENCLLLVPLSAIYDEVDNENRNDKVKARFKTDEGAI